MFVATFLVQFHRQAVTEELIAGLVDQPHRIYTGHLELAAVPLVLARQLAWTIAFVAAGRWLLRRALRALVASIARCDSRRTRSRSPSSGGSCARRARERTEFRSSPTHPQP